MQQDASPPYQTKRKKTFNLSQLFSRKWGQKTSNCLVIYLEKKKRLIYNSLQVGKTFKI